MRDVVRADVREELGVPRYPAQGRRAPPGDAVLREARQLDLAERRRRRGEVQVLEQTVAHHWSPAAPSWHGSGQAHGMAELRVN